MSAGSAIVKGTLPRRLGVESVCAYRDHVRQLRRDAHGVCMLALAVRIEVGARHAWYAKSSGCLHLCAEPFRELGCGPFLHVCTVHMYGIGKCLLCKPH